MRDIPIIFSASMVRALLREVQEPGTGKSMTRRLRWVGPKAADGIGMRQSGWTRVKPGDQLWVRERFSGHYMLTGLSPSEWPDITPIWWWADGSPDEGDWSKPKPSIHMPRWASRLTLVITGTKVERLKDISEQDCEREGLVWDRARKIWGVKVDGGYSPYGLTAQECFMNLFCDLHGPAIWNDNPEVVALTFKVYAANIDAMKEAAE